RRTRGRRRDPVGAMRPSDTSCAGASRAHDDEPATLVQHLTAAEFCRELLAGEDALEDRPPRAVPEDALFVALDRIAGAGNRRDDDELRCHAARLGEEALALGLLEVAVEVAREHAVERPGLEWERERVALDERRRRPIPRECEHPLALVQSDHVAAQVTREKA